LAVKNTPNSGVDFLPILHRMGKAVLSLGQIFAAGDPGLNDFVAVDAIQARASGLSTRAA
jgi:hypothetical protein